MPWVAAAGSIVGGLLGGSGGGGNTMPKWLRQANRTNVTNAQQIANTPQQFYPGQTFVGGLPWEQAAFDQQSQYNQSMFGGQQQQQPGQGFPSASIPGYKQPQPVTQPGMQPGVQSGSPFGNVLGSMNSQLMGSSPLGQMASALPNFAAGQLGQSFQGPNQINPYQYMPNFGQAGGLDARGTIGDMLGGQQGFSSGVAGQANSQLGQFGQAGNLDATNAFQRNLSGQGDYSTLQANIEAANAPILRQLNQEIIPGLNSRATFLNNGTGGIKSLNRILPDVAERMSQNATGLYEGERQRALGAQQNAMGQVGQAGLQQGAQRSSQMFGAGMQGMQDRSNAAGLVSSGGLSAYGLGLQGSGMNADQANQYRSDTLGLGNLAGGLAGDQATAQARMAALFPSIYQAGRQPSQDAAGYAQYQRGLAEAGLGDAMNRFNFYQQEPMNRVSWMTGILGNTNGGQVQPSGNTGTSILGGALAGGQLGSMFGNAFSGSGGMPRPSSIQGSYDPQFPAPVFNGVIPSLWGG